VVTKKDYNQIAVKAAYSVLIEVARILSEYRDNIVLIGGWVPQFLFQNDSEMHTGSIDIDLALDHRQITDEGYKCIHELLVDRGSGISEINRDNLRYRAIGGALAPYNL